LLKEDHSFWYAGDFDPEGLLIAQNLKERYKTAPHIRKPCWKFIRKEHEDLQTALPKPRTCRILNTYSILFTKEIHP